MFVPEPLHPLVIDDLACPPQQGMGAADAEARVLALDLCEFRYERPLLSGVDGIAGRRTGDP